MRQTLDLLLLLVELPSVQVGHHQIQQDQPGQVRAVQQAQRLAAAAGGLDQVPGVFEDVDQALAQVGVVVDQQDVGRGAHVSRGSSTQKVDAGAQLALHRDRPVAGLDDLLGDPETQPQAREVPVRRGAFETLEDARQGVRRDADAGVADDHPDGVAALRQRSRRSGWPCPNLMAFDSRFVTTWPIRRRSQRPGDGLGPVDPDGAAGPVRRVAHHLDRVAHDRQQVAVVDRQNQPSRPSAATRPATR